MPAVRGTGARGLPVQEWGYIVPQARICTRARLRTVCGYLCTHTRTHTRMDTRTHSHTCTRARKHAYTHVRAHTDMLALGQVRACQAPDQLHLGAEHAQKLPVRRLPT